MMKKVFLVLMMGSVIVFSMSSCYKDNEEEFYQNWGTACDTANVSFSSAVVPILQSNCLGCHSAAAAAGSGAGIILEGHAKFSTMNAALVVNSIKQNGQASAMPKGGNKLDNCSISKIEAWFSQGKQNN